MEHLGESTGGVWTRTEALAVATRHVVDRRAGREWQRPWPGVYADAGHELDAGQRVVAAVLATGAGAAACGLTAARWWGLTLIDDGDPATGADQHLLDDVSRPCALSDVRGPEGRLLRRHRLVLEESDVVPGPGGVPVTSLGRTVLDWARLLAPDALICLLDDLLHRERIDLPTLQRLARRSTALRAALALVDGRAESPGETLTRLLFLPLLPQLVPQVRLLDGRGQVLARFDLAHEAARFALETDGRAGHEGVTMVAKDRRRDRAAVDLGWVIERCTWYDLRCRQSELVRHVLRSYERAAGAVLAARRAG